MSYEHIQLIRDGHVATLKLNRPEARNAMSIAMGDEVARAVEELHGKDTRIVVRQDARRTARRDARGGLHPAPFVTIALDRRLPQLRHAQPGQGALDAHRP